MPPEAVQSFTRPTKTDWRIATVSLQTCDDVSRHAEEPTANQQSDKSLAIIGQA
jgi:hypothetical protein